MYLETTGYNLFPTNHLVLCTLSQSSPSIRSAPNNTTPTTLAPYISPNTLKLDSPFPGHSNMVLASHDDPSPALSTHAGSQ